MRKWKVIAINLLVLFVLFNLAYWSLPTLNFIEKNLRSVGDDTRARHPNYASLTWAADHYREFSQLETVYKSFIGWRRKPFQGKTINISGPYAQRQTVGNGTDKSKKVYFFGGSTMWGTGAPDDGTIPSQFAAQTGFWSENFGETAYTAHQGLVLLLQLLQDGHRPDVVVFYDGVNDVHFKCRAELTPDSHGLESKVDEALKSSSVTFTHYFFPIWRAAERFKMAANIAAPTTETGYDCDSKPEKAAKIAEKLVRDWQMAKQYVESYGGKFVGLLQPVSYFSKTRLDHTSSDSAHRKQFQAVYPLVERNIAEGGGFHSLVGVLDVDEYVYVDFCHLSPNGNQLITARIAKLIQL